LDFCLKLDKKRITQIIIITNATIIPSEPLVKIMKDPRFILRISDFGVLSRKMDELVSLCKNEKINYELLGITNWYKHNPVCDYCSDAEAERKYKTCTNIQCYVLNKGYVFPCCKLSFFIELGLAKPTEENSINCFDSENLHKRIKSAVRRFNTQSHLDICHTCTGLASTNNNGLVAPAIQTNIKLELPKFRKN
jgi:hypothetical protein